ncbi:MULTISPECIES: aspartyl/asparaginyl beta-hydroxylase domain-containing protein [unclassified Mesorhizobium]|uniref:aspartyl/asparaginyl beta-hydroxylase domain-containing protein n=1 Tax=unclassified Mesorhizobium TaxID=325217 RepID=UPI000BAF2DE1|nr:MULTISPECIES: aspartyl/asparaginyl beta-hydroxylase domain-containing protein [unclassified Mesorhizobium]TGT59970.1 aspartyl/asparaginyl beta-hydroxylase domain-containing protein [Mesorhizobium sp. M00.F.Ca.ET.170.01.1.1]AZO08130.1 aspartyl/asparaginyl beta-hydroxylase domain-containing protein [Mesorhizobium sp. M3A.F.Ca.ET.080.04.2.1]PBB85799.1 aspartyl beta-hydroxylase [Mesorhizobium sp. WSM3876]RWB89121.1 MAG: aspartyl/asparaginyl beta-hydroxylase domain-containing protein [Mesorhizobi
MTKQTVKTIRKAAVAALVLALGFYFIPLVTTVFIVCGLIDVMRNDQKNAMLFERYFLGNGLFTWLLSPFNLVVDLLCYRNPGVWTLDQFPQEYQREINEVLDVFKARKDEIIADIDANFGGGRRGMYVYQWYGKHKIDSVPEFNKDFTYVKTIAVSVFSGRESTSWHFGPLRLSLRLLYNLIPVKAEIFVQCGSRKNYWHDNPLFIFDDTLFHRSVNEYDGRRYCVFVDIVRPSPFPGLIAGLLAIVSVSVERINSVFYKNWKMIGSAKPKAPVS